MRLLALLFLCCALVAAQDRFEEVRRRTIPRSVKKLDLPRGGRATADYQLPKDVWPVTYDITIIPYLETSPINQQFTFDATVITHLTVTTDTNKIVMHSSGHTILSLNLRKFTDNSPVGVTGWDILLDDRQFFTINLGEMLMAGNDYILTIAYVGLINADLDGFYRYSYMDENGTLQYMAATDLEPTGARRIVPWFDEPGFKANMTLHIAREPGRIVTANMPIESEGDPVAGQPGWEWVHFYQTPPMATYLFAFAVHKYSTIINSQDPRWQLMARKPHIDQMQPFLDLTPATMIYFGAFTGVEYMMPKLDHFSLIQFTSGGMENWGLINYREEYLMYDEKLTTTYDWQWDVTLETHEVAHMWFGDYVTPSWWHSLWLNEGFASYFEVDAVVSFTTDWQLDEQFITDYHHPALTRDASVSTHPIYANVDSPNSIHNIFDTVTYSKGGCIVRFMINYMTERNFKLGLNSYFNLMKYQASDEDMFYSVMAPFAPLPPNGFTFPQMMDTWTKQAGYPLVTVTRNYADGTASVKQERYGSAGTEEWVIPLTMTNQASINFGDQTPQAWLLPGGGPITIQAPQVPSNLNWLIVNNKQVGFYRVNYDVTNWALIASFLGTPGGLDAIAPENRAQLMNDALNLARVGRLDYTTALTTTAYLNLETRLVPWVAITDDIPYVRDRVYQRADYKADFYSYMRSKLANVYSSVNGFGQSDTDTHATLLTRYIITRWACNMEDVTCNDDAVIIFRQWQQLPDPDKDNNVLADQRTPVYCSGQRRGGMADYDFLMARYHNAPVYSDEAVRLLNGIGCASDTNILMTFLTESLNAGSFAPGDHLRVLRSVSYNPIGVDLSLDFIITNWMTLDPLYGNIGDGFLTLSSKLNTQEHRDKIVQFRKDHMSELSAGALSGIQSTLNYLDETLAWNFAYLSTVTDYFKMNAVNK